MSNNQHTNHCTLKSPPNADGSTAYGGEYSGQQIEEALCEVTLEVRCAK